MKDPSFFFSSATHRIIAERCGAVDSQVKATSGEMPGKESEEDASGESSSTSSSEFGSSQQTGMEFGSSSSIALLTIHRKGSKEQP